MEQIPATTGRPVSAKARLLPFAVLACGHLVVDAYSSGYAPLLHPLRERLGLTAAQVGGCTAVLAVSSSLLQPLYGLLSDRLRSRAVVALAPAIAGLGLGALPWSGGYPSALFLFFVAGIGIAAFHPQGVAQVRELARRRPGLALSLFFGSGSAGFALGPVAMGQALTAWEWPGLWRVAIPGFLASLVLLWAAPRPHHQEPGEGGPVGAALARHWHPLLLLYLLVVIRGAVQLTYLGFLPLYLLELGYSLRGASWGLGIFLACGSLGGLLGGLMADRWGGRAVIRTSMAGPSPCSVSPSCCRRAPGWRPCPWPSACC